MNIRDLPLCPTCMAPVDPAKGIDRRHAWFHPECLETVRGPSYEVFGPWFQLEDYPGYEFTTSGEVRSCRRSKPRVLRPTWAGRDRRFHAYIVWDRKGRRRYLSPDVIRRKVAQMQMCQ